jgi:FlaA1/EpsC-like NDP-sugar epimerase
MLTSRRTIVIWHDIVMIGGAWMLAWLIRFNFVFPAPEYWSVSLQTLPAVLLIQGVIAWRFGLYRGLWRFASIPDLWGIIRSAVLGALCITLALFVAIRLQDVPRSVLVMYPILLVFLLGGPRLGYRLWKDRSLNLNRTSGQPVLVVGAGTGGEALVRDMLRDGPFVPVGFVDDSPRLTRARIHGVPVLGGIGDMPRLVAEHDIDLILIAIQHASGKEMQRVVEHCEATGKPVRTLPPMRELVSGRISVNELRDISISDVLGRQPVALDWPIIKSSLTGKNVLVTGGGGSIGSELCRQVARLAPKRLVVIERSEHALFELKRDLDREFPAVNVQALLGDVCDAAFVDRELQRHQPQVIFHAAAYKHLPLLEYQVREAVRNNVLGTETMATVADAYGIEKFVMISTDKAVNPSSIMGTTKRIAELVCVQKSLVSKTRFITVRFGNVLGSAGSVVPLFEEQIRRGGPVTVTHPEMARFFMTITEACELILQAEAMGSSGDILVLDMGPPVKIAFLADQMIRLAGKIPGEDIAIEYIGARSGEKLQEELFYKDESLEETRHSKILRARQAAIDWQAFNDCLSEMRLASDDCDAKRLARLLEPKVWCSPSETEDIIKVVSLSRTKS